MFVGWSVGNRSYKLNRFSNLLLTMNHASNSLITGLYIYGIKVKDARLFLVLNKIEYLFSALQPQASLVKHHATMGGLEAD